MPNRVSNSKSILALVLSLMAWTAVASAAATPSLSPGTAKINLLGTATFTLSNVSASTQVTWQLISTAAGSSPDATGALGTVDATGHYKAPSVLPKVPTVTIRVMDKATPPNLLASATITLADPVGISPSNPSVRLGATQTFAATGVPSGMTIKWAVVGAGSIDSTGKYTAPSAMPASNAVTIQAVDSTNASNVLATATVALLNPIPVVTGFTPTYLNVNLKTTLKIAGSGFVPGSVLQLDGKTVTSTYVSATEIDYAASPTTAGTTAVTVVNPTPDGKTSNTASLTTRAAVALSLAPTNGTVRGGDAMRLYPEVQNNSDQTVRFTVNNIAGGNATVGTVATDSSGNWMYNAPLVIPGNTVTIAGKAGVDPNATASITVNLQNPIPTITSVSPSPLTTGTSQTITITGTNFLSSSTVTVGGVAFTAKFGSSTSLTATGTIPAISGRQLTITVANPAPGASTSAPVNVAETSPACTATDKTQCLSYADAMRFLEMASWGPTPDSVAHLQTIGRAAWLAEQFAMPSPNPVFPAPAELTDGPDAIQTAFFNRALNDPEQLRQRVAFALSEILVVSATKDTRYEAMRRYMQDLTDNAFGTYRNMLGVITLDPGMGWFLDMVNNDKANPSKGTAANENYAREVMQLMSIGLTVLNQDGTPVTPAAYTYDDNCVPSTAANAPVCLIPEMAKVFTGWTYAPQPPATGQWTNPQWFEAPMVSFDAHHDQTQKNIAFGGAASTCTIPAGGTALSDLNKVLDCLASHPNVPPFISSRLIQRLVKSDPSPAYVQRVAKVFTDDGTGTRGNLKAVVTAILTDTEATTDPKWSADSTSAPTGKLREPVLFATSLLRALNVSTSNGDGVAAQSVNMGQQVLFAPSVFNYFSPFYRIPNNHVGAPEFQILNAASSIGRLNFVYYVVTRGPGGNLKIDLSGFAALPSSIVVDPTTKISSSPMIDAIDQALYRGEMPSVVRSALVTLTGELAQNKSSAMSTAQTLIYFAAAAPQYQVEQ